VDRRGRRRTSARLPESCRYRPWGPDSYEQTEEYVRAAVSAGPHRTVIAVLVGGEVVGAAELSRHGPSTAEIGYGSTPTGGDRASPPPRPGSLLRLGFGDHALHRIFGACDPRNVASAAVLRRIGMRHEGRLRGTVLIRDGWRDSDLYAILADD
jgi:RimJ/RimL family protein N-acetyltransferase